MCVYRMWWRRWCNRAVCTPCFLLPLQVAEENAEIQEFVRAADTPQGHAALAELHLADLYSDFEGQDSADSCAASSQLPSDRNSCKAPGEGRADSAAAADSGRQLPSRSANSCGDLHAAVSDGTQPDNVVPITSQNGDAQLGTGSGGSGGTDSNALPDPRRVSLLGDDIYAAFGTAESGELEPQPQPMQVVPPAVLSLQCTPQPAQGLLTKLQSSREAPRPQPRSFWHSSDQLGRPCPSCNQPQPRRFRQSSEQLQLGSPGQSCDQPPPRRPRPSCDGWRKQQLQQRAALANGHANGHASGLPTGRATQKPAGGSSSKSDEQPASGTSSTAAQGSEATYAIYQKYHQAHPLPLPAPLQPLPERPPAGAAAPPPVRIKDATYDGEDAFTVYRHFSDGSAPRRPPKAEDGSYAGEDAYSVYGRFAEDAQLAAAEAEHDLYTGFAEA